MSAAAESTVPNLLPAALAYVQRFNWPVFPVHGVIGGKCTCDDPRCSRPGKHPIARLAPRGLLDATLDPTKVTEWWRNAPYANVGVPTGAVSGLVVLDVDCAKGGDDGLFQLQHEQAPLPSTAMALTGGGGYHYLFQHPGNGVKIKNSVRALGEGLDVRGDGGYIIVAPSSHASGRRYEWELSCHPREVPLAPVPDWLLPLISNTPRPATPPPGGSGRLTRREMNRIRDALQVLDSDGYDQWLTVGMALHSTGDPAAFALWADWAAKSPKFDLDDHKRRWASFRSSGVTLGTLFSRAKACGYVAAPPPPADPPPPPFDPPPGGPNGPGGEWESRLYRSNRGDVITSPANLETILEHHEGWAGVLAYDEMSYRALKLRAPPYRGGEPGEWSDADDTWTAIWVERNYGMRPKNTAVAQVVQSTAKRVRFHQVRDWMSALKWDGIERIPTFFADFCGSPQTAYTAAVAKSFFISAVARAQRPGCKVDTMLVLEGPQGIGKSALILALFSPKWHIEISYPPGSLDFFQSLRGTWVAEFGEMAAFDKAETARIKQVLTQVQDTYRASYGHHSGTHPRQTIFVGSTNKREWGQDETGMRRFLPVECREIDVAAAECVREQLWAEALARFNRGEIWWDVPDAHKEQESRFDYDAWEELIANWIEQRTKYSGQAAFSVNDVYQGAIIGDTSRTAPPISRGDQTRIGRVLTRLGWQRKRERTDGARSYAYERAKP